MINCDEENTYRVIPYEQGLMFPLRLYHIVCWRFAIEKNKSFAEQLMEIVEGDWNVSEVAAIVGYGKPSNFAAAFKKKYGVSPKNYPESRFV